MFRLYMPHDFPVNTEEFVIDFKENPAMKFMVKIAGGSIIKIGRIF